MLPEAVLQKLDALPAQPGVYLFKDKKGAVVYVGKAKSLRSRVRSYFAASQGDERPFIPILQRTIGDLETIVAGNEKEATILENNLIKEHRPRYNVKLRDDKDFITLRLGKAEPELRPQVVGSGALPRTSKTGEASETREASYTFGASKTAEASEVAEAGPRRASERPRAGEWAKLEVVRRPTPDGARYFGPYHSATAARRTLHLVNKHFQLRTCSDTEFAARKRPCLQHQIERCPGPCVLPVDPVFYAEQVEAVVKFLEGRHDELSRELEVRMRHAARDTRFELAAVYRDQLRAIDAVQQEQRVVTIDDIDRDVLGLYREGELVEVALLHVRAGKLADVATYSIKQAEIPDEEIVAAFVSQHYGASLAREDDVAPLTLVPDEIVVPYELEAATGMSEWLADRAGHKVALLFPRRGHRVDLLAMARDNARHSFTEKQRQADDVQDRLKDLQERLRLPALPRRIECCDISHLGGGDTVGAIVAMADGELDKKHYRSFNVRGDAMRGRGERGPGEAGPTGQLAGMLNDDYGAMYEVLARRFRRALAAAEIAEGISDSESPSSEDREWEAPDLFVVDGGRGQLAVALAAAHDLGLHDLPIVALAKERETVGGETLVDRVYLPGQKNPVALGKWASTTTSLFLLARLRDEAHRFSNHARKRLGAKRRFKSPLDDVKGLGSKTKKALLTHIGGVLALQAAEDATILAVPGVTRRHLAALRAAFPPLPTPLDSAEPDLPTEPADRQRG